VRRLAVLTGAVLLATFASMGVGNSATTPHKISMIGRDTFIRNALIQSTQRFFPERNVVRSGRTIVLKNSTKDPHTFTIVRRAARPSNTAEVFQCGVCRKYPPQNNTGGAGIDHRGDSRFIAPGQSIKAKVTAAAGRRLYFMCTFHPWMQGKIIVR
jgi:plastocyanin